MSEAITEVRENAGDYLKSKLTPAQIQNIKTSIKQVLHKYKDSYTSIS